MANEFEFRHLIVKNFYYFHDLNDLGSMLAIVQCFVELERQYNVPSYETHQEYIDYIYIDEFEEKPKKIKEIKYLAKELVDKARKEGLDDIEVPSSSRSTN